jgi:hypothetical protein
MDDYQFCRNWRTTDRDRPVDWRFQVAAANAVKGFCPLSSVADLPTRGLTIYLVRRRAGNDARRRSRRTNGEAALEEGMRLQGAVALACELESLILADVAPYQISERLGISRLVVQKYEAIFFDVRQRLRYAPLVEEVAIAPELQREPAETATQRYVMKLIAYASGVEGLDDLFASHIPRTARWSHPYATVKRLAAQMSLERLVQARLDRRGGHGDFDAIVEAAMATLGKVCRDRYSPNTVERDGPRSPLSPSSMPR